MTNSSNLWIGNLNRDDSGQFAPKGQEKKPMRSMRLSDEDWEALGVKASQQGKSRTELIEEFISGKADQQSAVMKAIEAFIEWQREDYGRNGAQKGKDFNMSSRSWDYFNKFYKLIEEEPHELGLGDD
ncbi:MAG TPA: hypothetical protein VE944_32870 [Nostoc sp.]|uniref:hypothetical protein n=1 Tax=Nostoc sp. TaxID=1180 RepID=UPI002D73BE19|nr:hypothetical protein [Nostoc sp.]HYX19062.1 hypothetical protein [Nostoc sp.]